jgi:hypothetical protein
MTKGTLVTRIPLLHESTPYGYTFEVSLRIWHPTVRPDELSNELGMPPTIRWEAGSEAPHGRMRESTYWSAHLTHSADVSLARFLERAVEDLRSRRSFLEELLATGGRCELFVGLFIDRDTGEVLPSDLLRGLGEIHVDLALDIYCPARQLPSDP